jgi:hypothetical protein
MDTVTCGVERHDKNLWVFGNSVFIFNELTKPDPFAIGINPKNIKNRSLSVGFAGHFEWDYAVTFGGIKHSTLRAGPAKRVGGMLNSGVLA